MNIALSAVGLYARGAPGAFMHTRVLYTKTPYFDFPPKTLAKAAHPPLGADNRFVIYMIFLVN